MITFSKIGELGRLGNQLFQYALIRNISLAKGYELGLPDLSYKHWHGQKCLLDKLNIQYSKTNRSFKTFHEKSITEFDESVFEAGDDIDFYGFFQDVRYFQDNIETIRKDFSLKDGVSDVFDNLNEQRENDSVVSIHFRLGDNAEKHIYKDAVSGDPMLDYYSSAIDHFGPDNDFLVFVGGSRNASGQCDRDINFVKNLLKKRNENFIFSEGNDTLTDFGLMRQCDKHVIGFLSTFSLWIGYLANHNNVVVPTDYFCGSGSTNTKLYFDQWIKI